MDSRRKCNKERTRNDKEQTSRKRKRSAGVRPQVDTVNVRKKKKKGRFDRGNCLSISTMTGKRPPHLKNEANERKKARHTASSGGA